MIKKLKILITAGPTRERIDDVRYISNFSSGKMGFAIANHASSIGHEVILISGPVDLLPPQHVRFIEIESAEEMYQRVMEYCSSVDVLVMSAAVADFTPLKKITGKIKKKTHDEIFLLELKKTKDILKEIGNNKRDNQFVVGFALEAENEIEYGRDKLIKKNCDLIVINSSTKPQSGFGGDYNTISILDKSGHIDHYPPMLKTECASKIIEKINHYYKNIKE